MTYKKEKTQYTGDWKNDKKEGEGILAKFINNTYKEMITKVSRTVLGQKFDQDNVLNSARVIVIRVYTLVDGKMIKDPAMELIFITTSKSFAEIHYP